MWKSAVLTNAGRDLLAQWAAGGELTIDNAACGQGTVNEAYLMGQTQLVAQKKQLSIVRKANVAQGVRLQLQCTNEDVAEQFTINQIGVWAHLDDGASVMIAIYQDSTGVLVPSAAEMADYVFTFYTTLQMSNTGELTVTIDSSALVSMETFSGLEGEVDDILDGTTTVPKAAHAASADSATNAANATNANYATSAGSANTATNATNATNAQKATADAAGNTISTTYATKTENAAKLNKPTIEQYNIAASAWTSLSNADPFTVQATVTASTTIGADAIIELYNDQPVAFANYAFSIASVSGQTITFYAIEAPAAQVTLSVGITN